MKVNNKTLLVAGVSIVTIAAVFLAGYFYMKNQMDISEVPVEKVTSEEYGVSFSYPAGPEGFALIEPPTADKGVLKSYLMIRSKEYDTFKATTDAKETPATMSVLVFPFDDENASSTETRGTTTEKESRITRLQNWAIDNEVITSFSNAKNTPEVIEIDGLKALHYQTKGEYKQDIYLVSYQNRVYMFVSQYKKESDPTYVAFQALVKTISF